MDAPRWLSSFLQPTSPVQSIRWVAVRPHAEQPQTSEFWHPDMEISEVASTKMASGEAYTRSWWLILFFFFFKQHFKQNNWPISTPGVDMPFHFCLHVLEGVDGCADFFFLFSVLTKVELAVPYVSSYSQSNMGWASSGTRTMSCIEVGLIYDETCQSLKSDLAVARWLFFPHWASIWLIISPAWIKTPLPHSDSNHSEWRFHFKRLQD